MFIANKTKLYVHFVNDKKEGLGAVFFDNGRLCYEGSLKNGFYHGLGTLYYRADNQFSRRVASYVGPFVKNMRWGSSGKEYDQQGRLLYHGAWMLNHKVGHGRAYHTVVASASSSCSEEGGEEGKKKLSFIHTFLRSHVHTFTGKIKRETETDGAKETYVFTHSHIAAYTHVHFHKTHSQRFKVGARAYLRYG